VQVVKTIIRRYMLTGILVLIPLLLTAWALLTVFKWTDKVLALIPVNYRPEALLGFPIPGLGLIMTFLIILIIGAFVANVIGRKLLALGEKLVDKIPLLRWFYFSSKQMLEAIIVKEEDRFRRVVLVQYPRKGLYSIAFITGESTGELRKKVPGRSYTVFIPTTPNPTSGFLYIVPESEITPLTWRVDEAFRMIISAGVILPSEPEAIYVNGPFGHPDESAEKTAEDLKNDG